MTTEPVSATPPATSLSVPAVISLGIGAVLLFAHMTVKLIVSITLINGNSQVPLVVTGILGLLSIVLIAIEIAAGHVALRGLAHSGKRGRAIAIIGLTVGYVLFVLWANRVIAALIIVLYSLQHGYGDGWQFFQIFSQYA
jgi:hypothetical protein